MGKTHKKCSRCGRFLPANSRYFYRDARRRDGLKNPCISCRKKPSQTALTGIKVDGALTGRYRASLQCAEVSGKRVLCIGDAHEPVSHPHYRQFCADMYLKYKCDTVVFMGDIIDHQAISFHANNPNCPGAADEFELAKERLTKWYEEFPEAYVCIGNHDERVIRLAESVNIPSRYLRDHSEVWDTPGWKWAYDFIIDGVYYFHGTGNSGKYPAANVMQKMLMPVVMGHNHARAGVYWKANPQQRIFGMDVGCGIDVKAYQFAYGKHIKERPILACGVVLNGVPYHEIMPIGENEPYRKGASDG